MTDSKKNAAEEKRPAFVDITNSEKPLEQYFTPETGKQVKFRV